MKFPRFVRTMAEEALSLFPAVLITGARRVGKSTLAMEMLDNYITFDDINALTSAQEDPIGFVESIKKPVVLDEIQRVSKLLLTIKHDIDTHRKTGLYVLTGSANILLLKEVAETLSGRVALFELLPLSVKEIKSKNENLLDILFSGYFLDYEPPKIEYRDLLQFLIKGGFPEVQFIESDRMRYLWFSSYVSTYIEKDIRDIGELRNMDKFYRVFRLLASRSGNLLNKTEISRDAGVEIKTLENYIQLLRIVYQTYLLSPYHPRLNKRVIKSPKVHFMDSGLLCYLLGINSVKELEISPYLGRIFETFVFTELYKAVKYSTILAYLYFYRTTDKTEIDFIVERQNEVIAIEVKLSKTISRRDIRAILSFKSKEKKFKYGFIFYTGDRVLSLGENIFGLPIGLLF